jgi:hypothetical protein
MSGNQWVTVLGRKKVTGRRLNITQRFIDQVSFKAASNDPLVP